MKMLSRTAIVGAFLGLAGCGLPATFLAEPFINSDIGGSGFNAELARAYQMKADDAAKNDVNWILAGMYTQKGLAAENGETVLPWDPETYNEPPSWQVGVGDPELVSLRNELLAALDAGGREQRPMECAMAQANFDHLVDETYQQTPPPPSPEEQKQVFLDWLAKCKGMVAAAPSAPNAFTIYFGFDKSNLTAEAEQVIRNIVSAFKSMGASSLSVAGHTDTAGSNAYNQGLSVRRANSVASGLVGQGIGQGAMQLEGYGESRLAKPTADGTPEPLNRRAVVIINK